jgi:hypothetical protein
MTSQPIAQAAIDIPFKCFAGSYVLETRADSSAKSVWTQTVHTPVPT